MIVMLIAAFLFQPIRNWIQERLDRYFYRDRYDYRRTLIEFARELNSETDLDAMLQSVADRLMQTLSIRHVGVLPGDEGGEPTSRVSACTWAYGLRDRSARPIAPRRHAGSQLPELAARQPYIFFERTRYSLDAISSSWPASVRQTIADLDLNYYLPCTVRGRTIAYLGVSRTADGEFLSSEDRRTAADALQLRGIAIENATSTAR